MRFLEGEIRRLEKVIKSLRAENRSLKKHEHAYEIHKESQDDEIMTDSEDTHAVLKKLIPCDSDSCGKGYYRELDIIGRLYGTCTVCGYSKRLK